MPKLWHETIEAHRSAVHAATLDAAAALVTEFGLTSVTMSKIARQTGIGRATLYKYFPDVESILHAWHERHISAHLEQLARVRDGSGNVSDRLGAVLETYALIAHEHHRSELAPLLHRDDRVAPAQRALLDMVQGLLIEGAKAGEVRTDVSADELATFCLHALSASSALPSKAAVRRLVTVTLAALLSAPDRTRRTRSR